MYPVQGVNPMSSMTREELKELFSLSSLPASGMDLDPDRLPAETLEEFSYDGLEFEEAAEQIWNHLVIMHYHAGTYNRHSDWFPIACGMLEKTIRLAGSFCLTKTVLETRGAEFPKLEKMNLPALYGITSYYFRKCGKAFEDIYEKAGLISVRMHSWEMRWFALGQRLKATEAKCRKIREGKISVEKLLEREKLCSGKNSAGESKAVQEHKALELWANALPLLSSYAQQIKRERKCEARVKRLHEKIRYMSEKLKQENEAENSGSQLIKTESGAQSKASPLSSGIGKDEKTADIQPSVMQSPDNGMNLTAIRKVLIEKAKERGESSEILKIIGAPPEKIYERWRKLQRDQENQQKHWAGRQGKDRNRKKYFSV